MLTVLPDAQQKNLRIRRNKMSAFWAAVIERE